MKNPFFDVALRGAARLAGKNGRIALLLGRLAMKIKTVNWSQVNGAVVQEKIFLLGRLTKAYATGKYRDVPWKSLLIVLAAFLYFLNPLDLVPDAIPVLGLSDDFSVLLWVYNAVRSEVDKFLIWEKSQPEIV
jgi:uncharacterized membrane protein YkvA (DUF1232 family)